jgi:aminoglycoside phosphotransferase (APT) family kinase protein
MAVLDVLQSVPQDEQAVELAAAALGVRPLSVARQSLTKSGKTIYRVDLPDEQSVVLRISPRPGTFKYTTRNLNILRALGIPVQTVLAGGATPSGGSYVVLNWIPGRDLVYELNGMTRTQMTELAEQVTLCQRRLAILPQGKGFGWAPIGGCGLVPSWTDVFGNIVPASQFQDGTILGEFRAALCTLRHRLAAYMRTIRPTPFLDDMTTKNIIVENGELRGLIDIDYICYGDPLLAVGATMASIAAEANEPAAFYGEELTRCSNPDPQQRLAIWFYAALCAVGALRVTSTAEPTRISSLTRSIQSWLAAAQAWPS